MLLQLIFTFTLSAIAETSPVGRWKTIDDKTGKPKSVVQITDVEGKLQGQIVELFRGPEEDQNPLCDKCTGDKKDKPIRGMQILWDVKADGKVWRGGKILDPKTGDVYSVKLETIEDGKKLRVRGFMGISLLGRTQTWERTP